MAGKAYITVVRWPKGFTPENRLEALAEAMGIDPYTAGLRAVQEPPFIVGRVDESVAPDMVARFRARKVLAFALTQTHIAKLAAPQLVKRLVPAEGAAEPMYLVEFWKGDPTGLKSKDIFLLVRGTLDRSTTRTQVSGQSQMKTMGLGMGIGLAMPGSVEVSHSTESKFSQILDIYLRDKTLLRINSDRVSFDVLGKQKGFTAVENTDKVALRLAGEAPEALVDTGFGRFKPPADIALETSTSATSMGGSTSMSARQRDEGSAFDFYSGWIYTINRGLAGG